MTIQELESPRGRGTLIGLLAALTLGATLFTETALGQVGAGDGPASQGEVNGEVGTVMPELVRESAQVREWAWGTEHGPKALQRRVESLLSAAAAESAVEIWDDARPVAAIAEASLRLAGRDRAALAAMLRRLSWLAPSEAERVTAVRAEIRLLESVVVSGGASSDSQSAHARLMEIFTTEEFLSSDAPAQPSRIRERTGHRLATLCVGQPFPRFLARDTAGNEVRSSLLTGRVNVVRFWEPSSPTSMLLHEGDAGLVRKFWDAPVALIGATHSHDRDHYLETLDLRAFSGTQLFDGPISVALSDELAKAGDALAHGAGLSSAVGIFESWNRPAPGALFVIDEAGMIRGRDLLGDELEELVSQLVAERRSRLRKEGEGRLTEHPPR